MIEFNTKINPDSIKDVFVIYILPDGVLVAFNGERVYEGCENSPELLTATAPYGEHPIAILKENWNYIDCRTIVSDSGKVVAFDD